MKQKNNKRLVFSVLLLLIFFSSCNNTQSKNHEILQGSWIVFKSEAYKTNGYSNMDGYILSFDADTITEIHLNYGLLSTNKYLIKDSILRLNDSLEFKIIKISNDSLKLVIFGNSLITFIRIPDKEPNSINLTNSMFFNSSWYYMDSIQHQRIEFTQKEWEFQDDSTYLCHTVSDNYELFMDFDINSWRIMKHNGNDYLVKTMMQNTPVFYEITKISGDTVYTKAIIKGDLRHPKFIKVQTASRLVKEEKRNLLMQNKWISKEISFDDTYSKDSKESYLRRQFEKLARYRNSIENGEMNLIFTNDSIDLSFGDKRNLTASWNLSDDGEYIHISKSDNLIGFFRIVELDDDRLSFESDDLFRLINGRLNLHNQFVFEFEKI